MSKHHKQEATEEVRGGYTLVTQPRNPQTGHEYCSLGWVGPDGKFSRPATVEEIPDAHIIVFLNGDNHNKEGLRQYLDEIEKQSKEYVEPKPCGDHEERLTATQRKYFEDTLANIKQLQDDAYRAGQRLSSMQATVYTLFAQFTGEPGYGIS